MIQRKEKNFPALAVVLVIAIIALVLIVFAGINTFGEVNSVKIESEQEFTVKEGWGLDVVAKELEDEGIIEHPGIFKSKAKKMGVDTKIQPGTITVLPEMSYDEIIEALAFEDHSDKITIPEGYEIRQIADVLEEAGLIDREVFYEKLDPTLYDYEFLEDLPERENPLEGYLYPSTYHFNHGMSEENIIDKMLESFDENFVPEYYERAEELNMSVDEIVTLASIIEREAGTTDEMNKISGVFYNRLNTNMRLQSCATVQYILQERKENLTTEDTKIDSPYNTYQNDGLPVGPIASPGRECIEAALYPEETEALYFVLGADGKHIFSKTYEEHMAAQGE